ncbi:MAG: hypothetical protein HY961_06010 [Ignavibacteriae bacterium]|nr:hypothetical protein [Ignavibacteriota bacterium]
MKRSASNLFSSQDSQRIEAAIAEAEKLTSGEIVPYAVSSSDEYEEALWRAGILLGAFTLGVFVAIHNFSTSWQTFELVQVAAATLGASLAGVLFARYWQSATRFFAGRDTIQRRTMQRAMEAFLAEEVFKTRDRTGILLFLSLLEHKVIVMGDSGINAMVKQEEWDHVVKRIVDGIRSDKTADGLIEAIRECGELLKRQGVTIKADDANELSNKMRSMDR